MYTHYLAINLVYTCLLGRRAVSTSDVHEEGKHCEWSEFHVDSISVDKIDIDIVVIDRPAV
jgi:hypothetical protein